MASSTSRLALVCLVMLQGGCWTGALVTSARLEERVLRYDRFVLDADDLHVEYTAEISASGGESRDPEEKSKLRRRAVVFRVDALDAHPPHPVDSFPLRRMRVGAARGRRLPIVTTSSMRFDEAREALEHPTAAESTSLEARIATNTARDVGFRLCTGAKDDVVDSSSPDATPACHGTFYSAALRDEPLAWWVYPVAPLAIAFDLALLPIQILTLPPLLSISD